jgi:hypothetical protein
MLERRSWTCTSSPTGHRSNRLSAESEDSRKQRAGRGPCYSRVATRRAASSAQGARRAVSSPG